MTKKIALLNDTGAQDHFGCKMVMEAFDLLCRRHSLEIVCRVPVKEDWHQYEAQLKQVDLVVVNAEGTIHHNKARDLVDVALHYPTAIINGVFQELTPLFEPGLRAAKLVSCRESKSQAYLHKEFGVCAQFVPDVVFALDPPRPTPPQTAFERFELGMFDSEQCPVPGSILPLAPHLPLAAKFPRWLTGRFHGICLAAMWDVPFAAYASNSWKNEGLMADLSLSDYYRENWLDALRVVPFRSHGTRTFVEIAKTLIDGLFTELGEL